MAMTRRLRSKGTPLFNHLTTGRFMKQITQDTLKLLDTLERKRRLGEYAVVWQDNKPVIIGEMIEDNDVRILNISTKSKIFIEIKRNFENILKNPVSVMDEWKYKSTFRQVDISHMYRKAQFVQLDWIDSFVLSFIFYLYH